MTNVKFLKVMMELEQIQKDHNDFYELSKKYGFCVPWCKKCEDSQSCKKEG